jgi:hypothetical protein
MMRAVAAASVTFALSAVILSGQAPGGAKPATDSSRPVSRMSDGKPDLTGVWQGGSTRRGNWEEANSGLGVGGTGRDVTAPPAPASGQVVRDPAPYQPWAAKKVLEFYNRRGIDDPTGHCLPPGLPRANIVGLFPLQIVHTAQQVVILYEYMNVFRVIPINAKHPDDVVPTYMGDSVARWEGDTLVVDVIAFNDKTWLTGTGTFHSDKLHVTERYTRIDRDQINYEVTIEDPDVLTKPWTIKTTMMLREGTRLQEYVCAENNLDPGRYEKLLKDGTNFTRQ